MNEKNKIENSDVIELPDMESGVCSCESVTQQEAVRPVDIPRTWGNYCVCQFDPKRGKERKFTVEHMGVWKKK